MSNRSAGASRRPSASVSTRPTPRQAGERRSPFPTRVLLAEPDRRAGLAQRLVADPEHALDTLAREELGLNPAELGSPLGAAASSFVALGLGALLPLSPWLTSRPPQALGLTIALSVTALFMVGATLSLFTGRSAVMSGARMLALGALAGGVTYGIGHLLGIATG